MPALRQTLSKPFMVAPTTEHTHTVVFLHRFSEETTDHDLPSKVLSAKFAKNHKTLGEQFPTIRWVFPFAKTGPRPYSNLSAADKAAVGLAAGGSPYITQVILQEARRIGGLDKVILGGQGETAVAAHDAMTSFPEHKPIQRENPALLAKFLQETLHTPTLTAPSEPHLAGFVGMHAEDGQITRDVSNYSSTKMTHQQTSSKQRTSSQAARVNTSVVVNTPHRFIHGGYKYHKTGVWDGRRIDDFAAFLANDIGVYRVPDAPTKLDADGNAIVPEAGVPAKTKEEDEMSIRDKYMESLSKDKAASTKQRKEIMRRIEGDKIERKYKFAEESRRRRVELVKRRGGKSSHTRSYFMEGPRVLGTGSRGGEG